MTARDEFRKQARDELQIGAPEASLPDEALPDPETPGAHL
jgi:hypothetical protein